MTFTTKEETESATATLESANLANEQAEFLRIENARRVYATLFDKTNGSSPGHAARLNGSTNEKYGLAKSLSVMPGDTIKMEVYAKYVDANQSNWTQALSDLITAVNANTAGVVVDGSGYSLSTTSFSYAGLLNTSGSAGDGPKAYLNWLVFDRDYNFLNGGYQRISDAAKEYGQDVAHEKLSASILATEPGYVYIYLSNEETTPVEVFFDDFKVVQVKSPVIDVTDYFPFGLSFNSYQRENSVENNFLFQAKELQDELDLNLYDFEWRQYDPAIGRTTTQDPHAYNYWGLSPYSFFANDPINTLDPSGMDTTKVNNLNMNTFKPDEDVILLDEVVITPSENSDPIGVNKADQINATIAIPWELVAGAGAAEFVIAAPSTVLLTAIFALIPNSAGDGEREHLQELQTPIEMIAAELEAEKTETYEFAHKKKKQSTGGKSNLGRHQKGEARDRQKDTDKKRQKPNFKRHDGAKKKYQ